MPPRTAAIVSFPLRPATRDGQLARALRQLQTSLTEQRSAISIWRQSLEDLRRSMSDLHQSTITFRDGLDNLRARLAAANQQSEHLQD